MPDLWTRRAAALREAFRGGGLALVLAAAAGMVWANSGAADSYRRLFDLPIGVSAGRLAYVLPVADWVNDALMALFFLHVGLEIRRELAEGQLASLPRAAAPLLAALGGMVVPAALYTAIAWGDPSARGGWAIPVATDIAFSLAVLRVLGRRVPVGLKVFLTALAIIDDLAAIAVIALVYTRGVDGFALAGAAGVMLGLLVLNRAGVRALGPYMAGFVLMWACLARSGVHPTLAGVAVAFTVPLAARDDHSPARHLEHHLGGWVAWLVLPAFGLANAGLRLGDLTLGGLASDPLVPGIVAGLFLGKQIGVFGATWAAWRAGWVRLPAQLTWGLLYGAALLCGIGFTMSLFIGHLAFPNGPRAQALKAAVFAASLLSATAGLAVLALAARRRAA